MIEVICDPGFYIWYFHWGEPGSLNGINVLDQSSIVKSISNQTFNTRVEPYVINGYSRDLLYFLADGIYPKWAMFVKTITHPSDVAEIHH